MAKISFAVPGGSPSARCQPQTEKKTHKLIMMSFPKQSIKQHVNRNRAKYNIGASTSPRFGEVTNDHIDTTDAV